MRDAPGRALRVTAASAAGLGAAALVVGLALGSGRIGLALAVGLLLGSVNGLLAVRGLTSGLPMSATSLGRLAMLSAAGLGIGFLLGSDVAWLVLLGLAAAQVLLAIAAAREMLKR